MNVVTANRLGDGRVVYLADDGSWTEFLDGAQRFSSEQAQDALERARARVTEITGAYLVEVDGAGATGRERLRETIRSLGPTIRRDLGKQAMTEAAR